MCSGCAGGIFVCKKERLDQIMPLEYGAMTFGTPDSAKDAHVARTTASKLEPGSKPMIELIAMGASIDLITQIGVEAIFNKSTRLSDLMATKLKQAGYQIYRKPVPILNFASENRDLLKLISEAFNKSKISFASRGKGSRLSFHAYQHAGKNLFDQKKYEHALKFFEKALKIREAEQAPADQIESSRLAIQVTQTKLK